MEFKVIPSYPPFHPKYSGMLVKRLFSQKRNLEMTVKRILAESQPAKSQHVPVAVLDAKNMWIDEAVKYLGLDRTGIKRPEKAIHRLINKGALSHKKVSGRLVFDKAELDRVLANGDEKRGRGRPRKPHTA